jgi:hypothetical protein
MGRIVTMSKATDDLMQALKAKPVARTRGAVKKRVAVKTTERGKPVNMYMHPDDIERIRTLAAYLGAQGKRVSDSQVVKAALRVARADSDLLAAFEETEAIDQRFKRAKA